MRFVVCPKQIQTPAIRRALADPTNPIEKRTKPPTATNEVTGCSPVVKEHSSQLKSFARSAAESASHASLRIHRTKMDKDGQSKQR